MFRKYYLQIKYQMYNNLDNNQNGKYHDNNMYVPKEYPFLTIIEHSLYLVQNDKSLCNILKHCKWLHIY